ncbi:MAG: MBL fold metallo-hydrolase [Gemmatimonadetes bacterium]|nr:MBL fold metallo-hydrolase [Gemmatimonadota bacterium]
MNTRALVFGTIVVAGALSAAVGTAQQGRGGAPPQPSAGALQADKIRDNLYVLRGGGGNTAVFITASGVVLVDTKIAGWGQPIIERVKTLTDRPITTIINTHTHYDHVEGNVEFPPTVEVVAHENAAALMPEMRRVTGIETPERNVFADHGGRNLPTRTFTDRMTIGRGDDRVVLHYFGRAHTSGDAFIVFPVARALHTGDAFPNKGMPIMDANNGGSGVAYPDTIARAAKLPDIDTVITGHDPTTLTIADVQTYADFTRAFVDAVRAARKSGRTVDEVAKMWQVPERFLKDGYAQPAVDRVRSNAQVVWDELP